MRSSFQAKRIRIKFHTSPGLTEIFDADTGEPLYDVLCLELKLDADNSRYRAVLTTDRVMDPDLQGEVVADVSEVMHLSETALDVLTHQVERRLTARRVHGMPLEEVEGVI